jgi:hypothetical protein
MKGKNKAIHNSNFNYIKKPFPETGKGWYKKEVIS